jgi:hypothetical protein
MGYMKAGVEASMDKVVKYFELALRKAQIA